MTTQLNTFKAIWGPVGFAMTNRFQFLIAPPPGMFKALDFSQRLDPQSTFGPGIINTGSIGSSIAGSVVSNLLQFTCKKFPLPSSAFNTLQVNNNGIYEKQAGQRDFDPITVEFYVDQNYFIYEFFLSWQNLIYSPFNKKTSYPEEYKSAQSSLVLYNNANISVNPTQDMIFRNMWPSEIGQVEMDWEDDSQAVIVPITFQYDFAYTAWQEGTFKSIVNRGIRSVLNNSQSLGLPSVGSLLGGG